MNDDNHKDIRPAAFDAFAVVVAANVPAAFLDRMKAGHLKPSCVVFEQTTEAGLTAGKPVSAPVRDLLPEEAIAVIQRALSEGTVEFAVALNPSHRKARVQRL